MTSFECVAYLNTQEPLQPAEQAMDCLLVKDPATWLEEVEREAFDVRHAYTCRLKPKEYGSFYGLFAHNTPLEIKEMMKNEPDIFHILHTSVVDPVPCDQPCGSGGVPIQENIGTQTEGGQGTSAALVQGTQEQPAALVQGTQEQPAALVQGTQKKSVEPKAKPRAEGSKGLEKVQKKAVAVKGSEVQKKPVPVLSKGSKASEVQKKPVHTNEPKDAEVWKVAVQSKRDEKRPKSIPSPPKRESLYLNPKDGRKRTLLHQMNGLGWFLGANQEMLFREADELGVGPYEYGLQPYRVVEIYDKHGVSEKLSLSRVFVTWVTGRFEAFKHYIDPRTMGDGDKNGNREDGSVNRQWDRPGRVPVDYKALGSVKCVVPK
jgi:hypothetical protein